MPPFGGATLVPERNKLLVGICHGFVTGSEFVPAPIIDTAKHRNRHTLKLFKIRSCNIYMPT